MLLRTLFLLFCLLPSTLLAQEMLVIDAYARATSRSGAVYFTIHNAGSQDDRLLSVSTDAAQGAMLHKSEVKNGVASMNMLDQGVAIPAGSYVSLERAGNHVMLMGLTEKLDQGGIFSLFLTFEHAGVMEVRVIVDNERLLQ